MRDKNEADFEFPILPASELRRLSFNELWSACRLEIIEELKQQRVTKTTLFGEQTKSKWQWLGEYRNPGRGRRVNSLTNERIKQMHATRKEKSQHLK